MAAVISLTMQEDDASSQKTVEYITQLECENKHLRELLHFTQSGVLDSAGGAQPLADNTPINSPSTALSALSFPKNHPSDPPKKDVPARHDLQAAPHSGGVGVPRLGGSDGGYVHVATPLNSGQTTPVVGGGELESRPLLQQACDKLTDTQT